ncbi:MAG TPA: GNAT family N-acetyltransferase [Burkholderiaceae bacterium]|nr:GNAT family N-acetyltransferase [Burkholderiaceae bacterium]
MDNVEIHAERADHPEVVALLGALDRYLGELYEPEANHILSVEELLAPEISFFVARQGDRVVGTGAVRRMPGEAATAGRPYGEIKRMYVDPTLRGRRIGARLIETLEDALRCGGIALALLETGRDQHEAVRLYTRCGYVPRAAFGGYPDNGLSLFMGKAL